MQHRCAAQAASIVINGVQNPLGLTMSAKVITVAFSDLTLALACGDPNGPRSGLNILSGDQLSDTVGSLFRPSLTIQVLDGNLQPLSNPVSLAGDHTALALCD